MQIEALFKRPIRRPINGVIKADQNDAASVWQELDEYVVTKELNQHLRRFFDSYLAALTRPDEASGKVGVWISGFFGSGKSHFLKILSYLLENRAVTKAGDTRQAIAFFEDKIDDAMLFGDMQRAVASDTEVLLFNIDSKADATDGRDTILRVFLKVFNEKLGFCGDHPHIAHMERQLSAKGTYDAFRKTFEAESGESWESNRDAYSFHLDAFGKALSAALKQDITDPEAWMQRFESDFSLSVENFAGWIKDYLDKRGKQHRIVFLVDEIGQFIGKDTHLMLSLQTITENLGTVCGGRAWVVVTSQEDIDSVVGEVRAARANDFSKIQGRFRTRLSLSSANVDEVIQTRLLDKPDEVKADLRSIYRGKADILRHQLSFTNAGRTFKAFTDEDHFAAVYPFAPYQFQLVQRIFESIRKAGATGLHLARGERSLLDAFQSAATAVAEESVGLLVPLHRFYPSIESFLEGVVKSTIDNASKNSSLQDFDVLLLKTLFLVRYVDEIKGNVDNLITLFIDRIDADRLALRNDIEASLQRLEKETLIGRNGDDFFFLTNEERDVSREIKEIDLTGADEARELAKLVFDEVLGGKRKFRYVANKKDFGLNLSCDQHPHGNRTDGDLNVLVISSLVDDRERWTEQRCILDSGLNDGTVLIRLGDDETLARELRLFLQTDRYVSRKNDGAQAPATVRILQDRASENRQRRQRLLTTVGRLVSEADIYVAGQKPSLKSGNPASLLDESLGYLVSNTFPKLNYIEHLNADPQREIQTLLKTQATQSLDLESTDESNPRALKELAQHIELQASLSRRAVLHDLVEGTFARRPYGWPEWESMLLIVRLLLKGDIQLMYEAAPLAPERVWAVISTPARWRNIDVQKRKAVGSAELQKARQLAKDVFHQIGPDGEDLLFQFLQTRLTEWKTELEKWQLMTQSGQYPGAKAIADTLAVASRQLSAANSYAAIEQFIGRKAELLDAADQYAELKNFFATQKAGWDRLREGLTRFKPNQTKLEQDAAAGPALRRMQEILTAASPYDLIKEVDPLIAKVQQANEQLLAEARPRALALLQKQIEKVQHELDVAHAEADLRNRALRPLQALKQAIEQQTSLAHLYQHQQEAEDQADAAIEAVHAWLAAKQSAKPAAAGPAKAVTTGDATPLEVHDAPVSVQPKKPCILRPAALVDQTYLETAVDAAAFIGKLQAEITAALARGERVEIR